MYDMYPEWGASEWGAPEWGTSEWELPTRAAREGVVRNPLQEALDRRDNGGERPDNAP